MSKKSLGKVINVICFVNIKVMCQHSSQSITAGITFPRDKLYTKSVFFKVQGSRKISLLSMGSKAAGV